MNRAPKEHKNQVFPEVCSLVCKWPVSEKVNWGQTNIYPGLLKSQERKDALGVGENWVCGDQGRFYWATLNISQNKPRIWADKSLSLALWVPILPEAQGA